MSDRVTIKRALLLLLLPLVLPAGAARGAVYEYDGAHPPRYVAAAEAARYPVVLVLGSGGRRGFAHAGVLRVLEGADVKPDLIVGVSIGSVIGALYAGGMSAAEVERLALEIDLSSLSDFSWIRWGRVRGQKLQDFVNTRVQQRPLEALGVRLAVVATREQDGTLAIFNRGDTGAAVRASSAVPGRFYPVRNGGEIVDRRQHDESVQEPERPEDRRRRRFDEAGRDQRLRAQTERPEIVDGAQRVIAREQHCRGDQRGEVAHLQRQRERRVELSRQLPVTMRHQPHREVGVGEHAFEGGGCCGLALATAIGHNCGDQRGHAQQGENMGRRKGAEGVHVPGRVAAAVNLR